MFDSLRLCLIRAAYLRFRDQVIQNIWEIGRNRSLSCDTARQPTPEFCSAHDHYINEKNLHTKTFPDQ
jgi:hypothetical protein